MSLPPPEAKIGMGARVTLAMLSFVYVLNFLDRQLVSILAKPIQDGLHITDGQLGKLQTAGVGLLGEISHPP